MKKLLTVFSCTMILFLASFLLAGPGQASAKNFSDVPKSHPNYEAIHAMQQAGYIGGYPDGTFRPNDPISRKHVAKLLDQAVKLPALSSNKVIYKDVPKNHPYYTPIMKLSQAGIVSGSNGKYTPDASITRIQMAKVLDLAFNLHMGPRAPFDDVHGWGLPHANALYNSGVSKGDNGSFHPKRAVTRAHYAEFLHRAIQAKSERPDSAAVTKSKAVDLSYRLPYMIEQEILNGRYAKQPFSSILSKLAPLATKTFISQDLQEYYPHACTECDSFYFPWDIDTDIRFTFTQPDSHTIYVKTVEFADGLSTGGFVEYEFKKESGVWMMDDYSFRMVGTKHLVLTVDEAKKMIVNDYKKAGYGNINVTHVTTRSGTGRDYLKDQMYTYPEYIFRVATDQGGFRVQFQSNDGMYFEE